LEKNKTRTMIQGCVRGAGSGLNDYILGKSDANLGLRIRAESHLNSRKRTWKLTGRIESHKGVGVQQMEILMCSREKGGTWSKRKGDRKHETQGPERASDHDQPREEAAGTRNAIENTTEGGLT